MVFDRYIYPSKATKKLNHAATIYGGCGTKATMANNSDIMTTIQGLRAMLETLEAQVTGNKAISVSMTPTAEKPKRQASEALKAWNAYVDKVKADMVTTGWTHPESGKPVTRKDAMIEAKARRDTDPDAYKPKPKPADKKEEKVADGETVAKPKRVLTDEHKAKMAAGRRAAAERRKAEKVVAAAETVTVTVTEAAPPNPRPAPKSISLPIPTLPESDDEDATSLLPITIKGKKYLYNPDTNGCYKRTAHGEKGEWAGLLDPVSQKIDDTVQESDLEGVYEDDE